MIDAEAMNSVTEKHQRRRFILTETVLAGIPMLVEQGLNTEAIAARLGCKVSTLKVRCSQAQISLRVPKEVKVVPLVPALKPPKQKQPYAFALPTTLQLSRVAMSA
jgi:DNA-binding NarL/FixJ family response regulator